ncbi:MAG: VanW family protein [Bacillota bacterium]
MRKIILAVLCSVVLLSQIGFCGYKTCEGGTWQELSSFSTQYKYSMPERKHNINLSASKLDGVVIKSGETLSFNKAVGKRTEENGYKIATVIENGVYTGGVGGGVCQTSTTLYNAVLRAGLKIVEVHQHTLSPEYVDASFDAMVSSEGSDLVIKNIYPYPVKISTVANGDTLLVKIYSTKKIKGLEILPYNAVLKIIAPPETVTKLDTEFAGVSVPCGEMISYRNSKIGKVSKGYIMYKYRGRVIRIKQIRSDLYIPMQGINIMGTTESIDLHS